MGQFICGECLEEIKKCLIRVLISFLHHLRMLTR